MLDNCVRSVVGFPSCFDIINLYVLESLDWFLFWRLVIGKRCHDESILLLKLMQRKKKKRSKKKKTLYFSVILAVSSQFCPMRCYLAYALQGSQYDGERKTGRGGTD